MEDRVRWPEWKYDVNTSRLCCNVPREKQARSASVFDVETLALLLPNILDIDIFMALASARSVHRQIFNSLAIKAAVHCLWIELISPVFGLTLLFNTLDLLVLALWGLTPSNRPLLSRVTGAVGAEEEGRYSSLQHPRFANFLLAGLLRDVANIGWWLFGLCRKWLRHQSQHSLRGSSAEARVQELRSGLHALWHPMKIFDLSHNTNTPEMILCLLKTFFLLSVQCSSDCGREMTDYPQALLAVCFFMHCVKLIYMLRVSSFGGKKILVLIKTLVSGAMREIFLIFCLFFLAFALTAVMLDRSVAVGIVSWSLYRGLIFGDGAGLDNMGFAIEGLSRGEIPRVTDVDVLKTLLTVMAILGTVTFIVILNMIIAIYSTEYGRLEMESDLLFQWERAKYCCNCLLGMQKLRSRNRLWLHLTRGVVIGCLAGSVAFFAAFPTGPDAMAAPPPFPLGALLLATAQVGMQALMMRSDWFAVSGGKEGPVE
ncbi:Herc2, partial [Symbiodinium sp. CCMP2456]